MPVTLRPPGLTGLPRLATWASPINPRHGVATEAYVHALRAVGLGCLVWTVDRPADMRRCLDLGVDGVSTHRPDVLADVLAPDLLPAA